MKYNYREELKKDIAESFNEYCAYEDTECIAKIADGEDVFDDVFEYMWIDDSVTGNASGSYTCNTWKAEEYLCHNMDLLGYALFEFGCENVDALEKGAEWCDVTIRCHLLGEVLGEFLEEFAEHCSVVINGETFYIGQELYWYIEGSYEPYTVIRVNDEVAVVVRDDTDHTMVVDTWNASEFERRF